MCPFFSVTRHRSTAGAPADCSDTNNTAGYDVGLPMNIKRTIPYCSAVSTTSARGFSPTRSTGKSPTDSPGKERVLNAPASLSTTSPRAGVTDRLAALLRRWCGVTAKSRRSTATATDNSSALMCATAAGKAAEDFCKAVDYRFEYLYPYK